MFPASSNASGQCMAFPDVCKTPAPPAPFVPIPYPNIAMLTQANMGTCASRVKIDGKPAVHKDTQIMMSSGDEGGTAGGGMISSLIKGPAAFKKGSSKVKVEGHDLVYLTCPAGQNGTNANAPGGLQIAPSQARVLVAP